MDGTLDAFADFLTLDDRLRRAIEKREQEQEQEKEKSATAEPPAAVEPSPSPGRPAG
jgi:hypothetical protein